MTSDKQHKPKQRELKRSPWTDPTSGPSCYQGLKFQESASSLQLVSPWKEAQGPGNMWRRKVCRDLEVHPLLFWSPLRSSFKFYILFYWDTVSCKACCAPSAGSLGLRLPLLHLSVRWLQRVFATKPRCISVFKLTVKENKATWHVAIKYLLVSCKGDQVTSCHSKGEVSEPTELSNKSPSPEGLETVPEGHTHPKPCHAITSGHCPAPQARSLISPGKEDTMEGF